MKKLNAIFFVVLIFLAIYILYKLIVIEELTKTDNILSIILLAGSIVQPVIRSRLNKKQGEANSTQ